MPERPNILGTGRICDIATPRRVYKVRMKNGFEAYAVVRKEGPEPPEELSDEDLVSGEKAVKVEYAPYDMSRCKIVEWLPESG